MFQVNSDVIEHTVGGSEEHSSVSHNYLIPWSRVLLEKLIVTQLVKNFRAFYKELEGSLKRQGA
jgi:hypothetical protein